MLDSFSRDSTEMSHENSDKNTDKKLTTDFLKTSYDAEDVYLVENERWALRRCRHHAIGLGHSTKVT